MLSKYASSLAILLLLLSGCVHQATGQPASRADNPIPGTLVIKISPLNQTVQLIKGDNLLTAEEASAGDRLARIFAFLESHKQQFRLINPVDEFSLVSESRDELGFTHIVLAQEYRSIPVWNGTVYFHFDKNDNLYQVQGDYFPSPVNLKLDSGMSEAELFRQLTSQDQHFSPEHYTADKVIFFKQDMEPGLAYSVKPAAGSLQKNKYVIDAISGEILHRESTWQTLKTLR